MKIKKTLIGLIVLLILILLGLSTTSFFRNTMQFLETHTGIGSSYYKKNGKIIFSCMEVFNTCEAGEVIGADVETFKPIVNNLKCQTGFHDCINVYGPLSAFARDKKNVYRRGRIISGADPDSFTITNVVYSKDKNNIFYGNSPILGADVESFELVTNDEKFGTYAKDNKHVYLSNKILGEANNDFKPLGKNYSRLNNQIYYYTQQVLGADAETFVVPNVGFPKDKYHVFEEKDIFPNADPETFKLLTMGYAIDKNHVYYVETKKILTDADPETFEVIKAPYSVGKDKNNVYTRDKLEIGVSPINFKPW